MNIRSVCPHKNHLLFFLSLIATPGCNPEGDCEKLNNWYEDRDVDGYGSDDVLEQSCGEAPSGYVSQGGDCDDRDGDVFPGAEEVCGDGKVNACDADPAEVAAACTLSGEVPVSSGTATTITGSETDAVGSAVASAGDIDGDGVDEMLVGAPGSGGTGEAWLYYGGDDGELDADDSWVRFGGEASGDEAGASVAGLGDLNGDGDSDVAVGAPGANSEAGKVYVVLQDLSGDMSVSEADAIFSGAAAGDRAGSAVAGVGDFNDDGNLDFAIGAPGADSSTGWVYLVTSAEDGAYDLADSNRVLTGLSEGALVGTSALGMDLTGDGSQDLIVGAPGAALSSDPGETDIYPGAVYAYLENFVEVTSLQDADIKLNGDMDDSQTGIALKALGDVTGDGYDDLAVGAPGVNFGGVVTGSVYVLAGPIESGTYRVMREMFFTRLDGLAHGDETGAAVEGPGDMNGDGLNDVLVGAPGMDGELGDEGGVYLVYGPLSEGTEDGTDLDIAGVIYEGEEASAATGVALAGVGDQDGNGTVDVLAGAPGAGAGAGAVYVLRAAGY